MSLLKPISGPEPATASNCASFINQDYPDYELLFGALDPSDPALPLLQQSASRHDHVSVYTGSRIEGANSKVRILHQLAEEAKGDILVISDSDVLVDEGFLQHITAPFGDESVGVVSCFYRAQGAATLGDRLHALHMSCAFAPGVACAERLGSLDFALGAALAIRRSTLEKTGGFEAIVDYLADDFQLGYRADRAGWNVVLSDYAVDVVLSGESVQAALARELRWHVTQRVSRPWGYWGLIFTHGVAFALAFAASVGWAAAGWGVLVGAVSVRATSAAIGARSGLNDRNLPGLAYLLPVRDIVTFIIWLAGFFTNKVTWRGRRLRVLRGGRIVEVPSNRVK